MRKLGVALAIAIASVGAARAADLPTKKEAPPTPVNCYASVWTWLNSTAADCPLSYMGFTVYGTVDMGVGYNTNGAAYTAAWNNGVNSFITKQNRGVKWLFTPNGLSQSVVGIKISQSLAPLGLAGWSLIGTVETGFNPYYGYLADAQRSQVQNNGKALTLQGANANSTRTGQWNNSQGFIGLSNKTYGTLTVGRVNTLSLDAINSYDPMGGSYAFSPLGFSGSFAGFGDTEAARANTAVKYRLDVPVSGFYASDFRVAGLVQWAATTRATARPECIRARSAPTSTCSAPSLRRNAVDGRHRQLGQGCGERRHFHRQLRDADQRTVRWANRMHIRHSKVL